MKICSNYNAKNCIIITGVLLLFISALFNSCKALIWENENGEEIIIPKFQVPEQGKTYTFYCRNTKDPYLENDDVKNIKGEWYKVTIEGNKMTVIIDPNSSKEKRTFNYSIRGFGDVWTMFIFEQNDSDDFKE